ncbi:hypothetical protein M409DRAFT_28580 [Zasmidium cellare ATCC 36951]|uniref:Methyltransferase domain-containing protein n=1 Tax=Zasmidium cellare ATCC 36951 TaxID=1080233 RepID=A0A6A6C1N9_ZASCE|nr:uncharacterized protein M409DRAFT_28580 [Zasmidium cellare ATCC 36951]KAF2160974.1 hypothetical protein M409DRAFT_28580 [Zasmidium cellare ATCC 36951]
MNAISKSSADYSPDAPEIPELIKAILTEYSGIPEDEIVQHVQEVRDKGWKVFQYPCLGVYSFLNLRIVDAPQYQDVLQHVKNGATILDLGCCFGQMIRKLVFDGAPGENVTGSELEPTFVDLGYELFRDKQNLNAAFKTGDFFGADVGGLKGMSFDYIFAASFFHIFTWEEQVEAMSRAVGLLKQKPGSMIFGWQTGSKTPRLRPHDAARSGEMYSHNEQSLEKLVSEVAEKTGVELSTKVDVVGRATSADSQDDDEWRYMRFSITRC